MRGKTARLLRKVAETNPYGWDNHDGKTLYGKAVHGNIVLSPGIRLAYKYLKKHYKNGAFNTSDLKNELDKAKDV